MWLITSNSFVSIVEHLDDRDLLIVRGRFKGDAARFLGVPAAREQETSDADYRFRIVTKREVVERASVRAVRRVRYPNFKDSIREGWRKALALKVWSIFQAAQSARASAGQSNG